MSNMKEVRDLQEKLIEIKDVKKWEGSPEFTKWDKAVDLLPKKEMVEYKKEIIDANKEIR